MSQEMAYEFEEIEIEKDGVTYVCYGVCNVEYSMACEMHYNGKNMYWPEIFGYDHFKIRICDVDGRDLEFLDVRHDHHIAQLIIEKFDEEFISDKCSENYYG
jgi:hypothetical protein